MATTLEGTDRCATCGADASGTHAYCHFYTDREPRVFCSPDCAEHALRGANGSRPIARAAAGNLIAEMVATLRWERWS